MTHKSTSSVFLLGFCILVAILATAAVASAQESLVVPVAPPEDAELSYNIPLQPWLVPTVLELKTEFSDGLSDEFGGIAENQTGEDLAALTEAGSELAEATANLRTSIEAIGELDVTFGIDGISRIIPAESALRDTLFGFVVWHEFSSTPARGMMTRFEGLVDRLTAGGEVSGDLSTSVADARQQLEQAIEEGDSRRIAELTPVIIEASRRIDAVCVSVSEESYELATLVDSLSERSGELLADRWVATSEAVRAVREPAVRTTPALDSMADVLDLLVGLGELVELSVSSTEAMSAAPEADGNLYIPWTVVRNDWEVARDLMERIVEEPDEEPVGEEEHGHEHADEYIGKAASAATKSNIAALIVNQVRANSILAERAVEHTSTMVAAVNETVEQAEFKSEGVTDELTGRRRRKALENVDRNMRDKAELFAANFSAHSAREALAIGRARDAAGAEIDALYYYHNAWLHSLNAGASAQRAVRE